MLLLSSATRILATKRPPDVLHPFFASQTRCSRNRCAAAKIVKHFASADSSRLHSIGASGGLAVNRNALLVCRKWIWPYGDIPGPWHGKKQGRGRSHTPLIPSRFLV